MKIARVIRKDLEGIHGKLLLTRLLLAPFPYYSGNRLRTFALATAGFEIGRGTEFWGMPTITGAGNVYQRLTIGLECWFNIRMLLNLGASITIGDSVAIGHDVMLLTESHEMGRTQRRAMALTAQPITIEEGVWIGSRSTVLPGVTIGRGAIVAAGSMVTKDVPPNVLVAGVPARVVRELSNDE